MKSFSLKFLDIMIGIVLGLGFQWWPNLTEPWQYAAFIFVYLDIVDYWIDYGPSLRKWPPKKEVDVFLDIAIMFALFLYIYTTQTNPLYFFGAFILWRVFDSLWLLRPAREYHPKGADRLFLSTWLRFGLIEVAGAIALVLAFLYEPTLSALALIVIFVIFRLFMRIWASVSYKKVHFS